MSEELKPCPFCGAEIQKFTLNDHAWASDNRLVLAQQKVDEKSNEITAIPVLLEFVMNFWPRVVDSWHWHGTESLPD